MASAINRIIKAPAIRRGLILRSLTTETSSKTDDNNYPSYIKTKSPEEWACVKNLLPKKYIPDPTPKAEYPSGWKPQTANPQECEYFIERSKNHMMPIYLELRRRGTKRTTLIKRIQGDIWKLRDEINTYLKNRYNYKLIPVQVNEVARRLEIKGDFVNLMKQYFENKGF